MFGLRFLVEKHRYATNLSFVQKQWKQAQTLETTTSSSANVETPGAASSSTNLEAEKTNERTMQRKP